MTALPPHWKQVFTGRAVDVLAPTVAMITLEDIAHALALTNRYGGHSPRPFNVAQHSVLVSHRAEELAHGDIVVARWGLLHDAVEAYVGDMIRPLKRTAAMAPFREAEARVVKVICAKFGLPEQEPAEVRQADADLLVTEAHHFFPEAQRPGPWNVKGWFLPISVDPWPWEEAERRFLERFAELWAEPSRAA